MNYSDLIQLYFERSTAMQNYWNLYVLIVGGILAFSSLRKQPATVTTLLVCILFALFAYENLGAMKDCTAQRFAVLDAIKHSTPTAERRLTPNRSGNWSSRTLTPAAWASVQVTHLTSDMLTIAALIAMEFRRRRLSGVVDNARVS